MKEVIHNGHKYFIGAPYQFGDVPCFLVSIDNTQYNPFELMESDGNLFRSQSVTPIMPVPITKVKSAGEVVYEAMLSSWDSVDTLHYGSRSLWAEVEGDVRSVYEMAAEKLGVKPE